MLYPIMVATSSNGRMLRITCPLVAHVHLLVPFDSVEVDALARSVLISTFKANLRNREWIVIPKRDRKYKRQIELGLSITLKILISNYLIDQNLYVLDLEQRMDSAELAAQVLDLDHPTPTEVLEHAMSVLNMRLQIELLSTT